MGLPPMRQAPSQAERARREAALMRGLPRDTTQEAMNIADEELAAVPTSDTDSESSYSNEQPRWSAPAVAVGSTANWARIIAMCTRRRLHAAIRPRLKSQFFRALGLRSATPPSPAAADANRTQSRRDRGKSRRNR